MSTLYQALVRYALANDLLEKPYHSATRFLWQLDLKADGSLASHELMPLSTRRDIGGKIREEAGRVAVVPRMNRTSGVAPMLGADDIAYVFGWVGEAPDPEDEKSTKNYAKVALSTRSRHEAWAQLTRDWAASELASGDPVPAALIRFLDDGIDEVRRPIAWTPKDPVIIHVDGVAATKAQSASRFWTARVEAAKGSSREAMCLICGRIGAVVDSFPQQVKGPLIPGGQTSGVAPVSINEAVYGYGMRRGLDHVPICLTCAQAIPTSLNHLLADPSCTHRTPNAATTWWIEGEGGDDLFETLDSADPLAVSALIQKVENGLGTELTLDVDQFYAVTLEGNASRMVVRDWTHLPLPTLQANILAWFADGQVAPTWPDGRLYYPLWMLAEATGRYDHDKGRYLRPTDKGGRHPHAIADTLRVTALQRRPLPREVATHVVQRAASDGRVDDPRMALLRLYLIRSSSKGTPMPGLDDDNNQPAYIMGRLMSAYEDLQYAAATADGGAAPNATFVDKYLAGAITSPRLVLTAGGRQAAAWLSKLRKSKRDWFHQREIDAIVSKLDPDDPGPTHANLDEQALFLLGYHHQRSHTNAARVAAAAAKGTDKGRAARFIPADVQS